MKKFFKQRQSKIATPEESRIAEYRKQLINELKKMGATEGELGIVCDAIIINAINNNRQVEDVAWAILQ